MSFPVPILLLAFNRPDNTRQVFEIIRQLQPSMLFIAADGPRTSKPDDIRLCAEVRTIVNDVSWPCEVKTLFRSSNLGCRNAVSSGITWFFNEVEEGIVLEDDIIPDPSFFSYCSALLEKYRDDQRVMMISGMNVATTWKRDTQSYHFSHFGSIWGWASWRRAWKYYDVDISKWTDPEVKRLILNLFPSEVQPARETLYNDLYNKKIDTWDFQWTFAKLLQSGLSIIPAGNLIRNIGDYEGTHVMNGNHPWANLPIHPAKNPLTFNVCVVSDVEYDMFHLGVGAKQKKSKKRAAYEFVTSLFR